MHHLFYFFIIKRHKYDAYSWNNNKQSWINTVWHASLCVKCSSGRILLIRSKVNILFSMRILSERVAATLSSKEDFLDQFKCHFTRVFLPQMHLFMKIFFWTCVKISFMYLKPTTVTFFTYGWYLLSAIFSFVYFIYEFQFYIV